MIGTDYHLHTHYVGCADESMTIPAILERCKALGRTSIAITDHCDKDWQFEKNRLIRAELERTDPGGLEVYFGCEVNLLSLDAEISVDAETKRREGFEIIVGGVHSTWTAPGDATVAEIVELQTELLCKTAAHPLVDVVVHPWWFPRQDCETKLRGGFPSVAVVPDELTRRFAEACIENHTAVELNTGASFLHPLASEEFDKGYEAYIVRLVELGCSIALSTDAHTLAHLDLVTRGERVLAEAGLPDGQVWRPKVPPAVTGSKREP